MRFVVALTLGTALVAYAGVASAGQLPVLNPAVVCAPSFDQLQSASVDPVQPLCLLRLSPLFEGTSFEVTPRAAKKRWVAELEIRF